MNKRPCNVCGLPCAVDEAYMDGPHHRDCLERWIDNNGEGMSAAMWKESAKNYRAALERICNHASTDADDNEVAVYAQQESKRALEAGDE